MSEGGDKATIWHSFPQRQMRNRDHKPGDSFFNSLIRKRDFLFEF